MAAIALGFALAAGLVPAEYTLSRESKDLRNPSAIWLRQEFPVQRMRIRIRFENLKIYRSFDDVIE